MACNYITRILSFVKICRLAHKLQGGAWT